MSEAPGAIEKLREALHRWQGSHGTPTKNETRLADAIQDFLATPPVPCVECSDCGHPWAVHGPETKYIPRGCRVVAERDGQICECRALSESKDKNTTQEGA